MEEKEFAMTPRTLWAAALAMLMLSTAAFAAGPTPKTTSSVIKKETIRRAGRDLAINISMNGTRLTGIVPESAEAIEPVISAVTLPSGETIALH